MKKIFTLAAIALFTLTSCSDNDSDATTTTEENVVLVKKIVVTDEEGTITQTFTYDANKITNVVSSNGDEDKWYYDNNDHIIKIEYYEDGVLQYEDIFEYNANGQVVANYWREVNYDYAEKTAYAYNANGTISTVETWGDLSEQTHVDGTGIITLTNGNITQYAFTSSSGPTTINNFTYDDKNDPFKNAVGHEVMTLIIPEGGVNNILTSVDEGNNNYTLTHTYNSDNYPTKTNYSDPQGNTGTEEFFYE